MRAIMADCGFSSLPYARQVERAFNTKWVSRIRGVLFFPATGAMGPVPVRGGLDEVAQFVAACAAGMQGKGISNLSFLRGTHQIGDLSVLVAQETKGTHVMWVLFIWQIKGNQAFVTVQLAAPWQPRVGQFVRACGISAAWAPLALLLLWMVGGVCYLASGAHDTASAAAVGDRLYQVGMWIFLLVGGRLLYVNMFRKVLSYPSHFELNSDLLLRTATQVAMEVTQAAQVASRPAVAAGGGGTASW
jgi:hypothetical protein